MSQDKLQLKGRSYDAHTIGRRKTSIARIYIVAGSGKIVINKRKFDDYFPNATHRYVVQQPLLTLEAAEKYDININVRGGGSSGQAGAIRLAVARALQKLNSADRGELKKAGFLSRDARIVERKKYGLSGARRAFQFSKR